MTDVVFGDAEPEDAWHPDDPVDEQVGNLARRADLLERWRPAPGAPVGDVLAVLAALDGVVARARDRPLGARDVERVRQLAQDIAFVRRRLW